MAPFAYELVADVGKLQAQVPTLSLGAAEIANGANDLLGEVAKSKVTGEEERYSHIDLVDFQANVDGAKKAFDVLQPTVQKEDAALATTITGDFTDVNTALSAYRQGNDFVLYTALKPDDVKTLAQKVDALAEPLSKVGTLVVG
jgi:iron uptake system component EfeO